MMDDTKTRQVKQKKTNKSSKKIGRSSMKRARNTFQRSFGVIQRIKPRKRHAVLENTSNSSLITENEEFDSDEHIENEDDWHRELDPVKMPHLLGPSATRYSPVPIEYQHLPSIPMQPPPFSCYQILIQCVDNRKPLISYVPCNYYQTSTINQNPSNFFHPNYFY